MFKKLRKGIIITLLTICLLQIGFTQSTDSLLLSVYERELSEVGGKVTFDFPFWYFDRKVDSNYQVIVNTLATFLKRNPELRMELRSHTDCQGNSDYNEQLSIRKAEWIRDQIITKGAGKEQVIPKGFGEKSPLIDCPCDECTEADHKKNQRFELVTIKSSLDKGIIEGRIVWNLTEFEGLYGIPDSLIQIYRDTFFANIKGRETEQEVIDLIADYKYLESLDLLYSPCRFVVVNDSIKLRIFFTKEDHQKINKANWFNKKKAEKLYTYLKMRLRWITEKTFFCEEFLGFDQRKYRR